MTNIDPAVDMTWARTVPTFGNVQPNYPTFSPPQFDAAKAYEAANSVMAGKLGNQIRQEQIKQFPVEEALRAADLAGKTRENRVGAATEQGKIASDNAQSQLDVAQWMETADVYHQAMMGDVAGHVDQHPDDQAAIDEGAKHLLAAGVPKYQVDRWAEDVKDPTKRAAIRAQGDAVKPSLSFGKSGASAAGAREEAQARAHVDKELQTWRAANPDATPDQVKQQYTEFWNQYHGVFPATKSPVAEAGVTPSQPSGWEWYLPWNWGEKYQKGVLDAGNAGLSAPEAAATKGIGEDNAARKAQLAGKPATPPPTEAKPAETKPAEDQGDGTVESPYRFTDEADMISRLPTMKEGEWFIAPVDLVLHGTKYVAGAKVPWHTAQPATE